MDETELVQRCIEKDPIAWNVFVDRYSGLVYWAIRDRLKKWDYLYSPEDVEEVHQNVFLSLWKKNTLQQVRDQKKIAAWLVMVSGNEAIDYFRYRKAQTPPNAVSIFQQVVRGDKVMTLADILRSKDQSPSLKNEIIEIGAVLDEEFKCLAPKEKIILELNILYNKKYREIASMLNMPVGSVSTALKDIKEKLKERLKDKI